MTTPITIDTKMHGRERITAAYVIHGEKTALVETGPKSRVDTVLEGLNANGVDHLDLIVVTHIHLDHAGAAGTLAARFPDARIAVHEVGAPHLVDPTKLWSSASRIYGDKMEELWGGIDPIAEDRIDILEDGAKIDLGGRSLQAIETPGHAFHHHALLDDATGLVFTGDAIGVRLPDIGIVRPATPPPEFHLAKAVTSIRRIVEVSPSALWPTHYGAVEGESVEDTCEQAIAALERWASWVREARRDSDDLDAVTEGVKARARAALEDHLGEAEVGRMEQTTSYRMNTAGYLRYLDKHEG